MSERASGNFHDNVSSLTKAGMTIHESFRVLGGECSDGPVHGSFESGWAVAPLKGKRAHWWKRYKFDPVMELHGHTIVANSVSLCGLDAIETDRVPLLYPGNVQRCAHCVRMQGKRR